MKKMIVIALGTLFATLTLSTAAVAQNYKCEGMGNAKGQAVQLTILTDRQVKIDEDYADLDETYNPRLNTGLTRFEYKNPIEGMAEVLLQEKLLSGADKGLIKIQVRGEGFNSDSYYCHP
jgi:hypothetical protein